MTASDPRVGEIQARLDAATPGPWEAETYLYGPIEDGRIRVTSPSDAGIHNLAEDVLPNDAEFIAAAPADVAYLLAELADRDEKLARVEGLAKYLDTLADGDQHYAALIRAAVAAAGGGGDRE